jgi:hypothetical protein
MLCCPHLGILQVKHLHVGPKHLPIYRQESHSKVRLYDRRKSLP